MVWSEEGDPQLRFIEVEEIVEFFRALNIEERAVRSGLDALLKAGLCLSYDPTTKGIKETKKLEVAPSGRLHLQWATEDWIYLESMAEVSPLLESGPCETIRACLAEGRPDLRRKAIKTFLEYLLEEDRRYCFVPKHDVYKRQEGLGDDISRLAAKCDRPLTGDESGRYVRHLGKMNAWNKERGFGFIRQDLGPDAFAHVSEISGVSGEVAIPDGTRVEYDLMAPDEHGHLKAVNIITLDWSPARQS